MQDIYSTFEFNKIQESIKQYSKTEIGQEKIDNLKMFSSQKDIISSLLDLDEMMSIINRFGIMPIATSANALYLINLAKKTGLLTPRDLNLIADDVLTSQAISKFFNKIDVSYQRILDKISSFEDLSSLEKEIHRVITSSLTIHDKATPELKEIRDKIRRCENSLQQKVASLAFTYSKYLNDDNATIRDGHFVLPVKTSEKSKVLGIIYDISDSGATTFIEPMEIVQINNQLTSLKVEENEEIRKILKSLTALVLIQEKEIVHNNTVIAELDFLIAKSLYAHEINAYVANNEPKQIVDLISARHPLIDPRKVVSNSYHLDEEKRIVIISGPNAGGKTVSLKTVGILVLMNQCGLAIPAEKAALGYFKNIYIDIGDNQSLSDNLSTFSAHMNQIGEITQKIGGKDLLLIDELGTGTDPKEGESLAVSIVKYLEDKHCLAMISSHFSALKEYAFMSEHIENSSMIFDEEKLLPTYQFRQGTPGMSYALDVANRYGICEEIVNNAKEFAKNSSQNDSNELIAILQKKLDAANKMENDLKNKEKEYDTRIKKLDADEKQLKEKRERLLLDVNEEKEEIVNKAKKEIEEIIASLKQDGTTIQEARTKMHVIEDMVDGQELVTYDEELKENDYVSIPTYDMNGRISKIEKNKAIVIGDNGMTFTISKDKLHKVNAPKINNVKKLQSKFDLSLGLDVGLELNIIGLRTEEAQNKLIKYLDNCRLKHFSQVRIIHGYGSGALRKMTREYLDTQKDVKYRPGDEHEGGGGATVVIFK